MLDDFVWHVDGPPALFQVAARETKLSAIPALGAEAEGPHVTLIRLAEHDDFEVAVPTPDHFIPMLYLAGLASAADRPCDVLVEGRAMGSLSMTAYTLDLDCDRQIFETGGAPPLGSPGRTDQPVT